MCHRGGEIDQDAEQYKVKSPLLKAELVRSKEMIEKETYNELSRRPRSSKRIYAYADKISRPSAAKEKKVYLPLDLTPIVLKKVIIGMKLHTWINDLLFVLLIPELSFWKNHLPVPDEHQSDTQVIIVKMEILLEPTSNKLMVGKIDTSAGYPVKEILLTLNLLIKVRFLNGFRRKLKDGGEVSYDSEFFGFAQLNWIADVIFSKDRSKVIGKSNNDPVSVNKEETSYIATKICDMDCQMLGDTFGTPNTSTKVATTGHNNIPSNKGEDGSIILIESAKSNGMGHVPYANNLNGKPSNKAINFRTLIAPAVVSYGEKEDLKIVPVWVKIHDVLITAFTNDELSVIAMKNSTLINVRYLYSLSVHGIMRHAKLNDKKSTKVGNNNSGSKTMFDVASSSCTKRISHVANYNEMKIVIPIPFNVLNMVKKDVWVVPSDTISSKGEMIDVNT
ncbi:hypothetical protein Tco_0705625 [Tanacetum coccineum]|uniref:DUF4283 domain-containing protein n=1 Tax=Tanacetum coccineum TaxID=301880 RepID=A0ABQ4Y597_9ASTR